MLITSNQIANTVLKFKVLYLNPNHEIQEIDQLNRMTLCYSMLIINVVFKS